MELYKLGKIPWEETQLIYHSLALLGREALCLVSPATPYVCIGFHQDLEQEFDLEFCRGNDIPIFRRELGEARADQFDEDSLNKMLAEEFEKLLGPMTHAGQDSLLAVKMQALKLEMMRDERLFRRGKQVDGKAVKVRAGLEVVQRMHKATGGLIRAEFFVEDGRFKEVAISGDYFCFPKDTVSSLEAAIESAPTKEIGKVITEFYRTGQFEWPGVEVDDWINVFKF